MFQSRTEPWKIQPNRQLNIASPGATLNGEAWYVDKVRHSQKKSLGGPAEYDGVEQSMRAIDEIFEKQGPFDGCLSFSQVWCVCSFDTSYSAFLLLFVCLPILSKYPRSHVCAHRRDI